MKPKRTYAEAERGLAAGYDQCQSPTWAFHPISHLLRERGVKTIWEPAAGSGFLAQAMRMDGFNVVASELDTGYIGWAKAFSGEMEYGVDFLNDDPIRTWMPSIPDAIVTNPPWGGKLKQKFAARCNYFLQHYNIRWFLLMPLEFIGSAWSQRVINDGGGCEIIFLDKRIDFYMPNLGWTGKSTNIKKVEKLNKKTNEMELGRPGGAQMPTAWFGNGWGNNGTFQFKHVEPFLMESKDDQGYNET